ncbi:hypothetical protein [Ornithinimicrobium cryptoxanthini]|uniref:hypothetical protein n=1 Tax=Ornithinimicrobium cryptoxanthini TaxID=2934161 RepID=UPI00351C4B51
MTTMTTMTGSTMPLMPVMGTVRMAGVINPLFRVVSVLTVLIGTAVGIIGAVRHVGAVPIVVAHGHAPIAYLSWSEFVPRGPYGGDCARPPC